MERRLFKFTLWGGRRVHVVIVPPEPTEEPPKPHRPEVPRFDWSFVHHGILHSPFPDNERPRGKRGR